MPPQRPQTSRRPRPSAASPPSTPQSGPSRRLRSDNSPGIQIADAVDTFGPDGGAVGGSNQDHSRLALEVDTLQQHKELLQLAIRLLESAKEKDTLQVALAALQVKYDAAVKARDQALQCPKCRRVTQDPVIIHECTHGYCLPCLRECFQTQLYQHLQTRDLGDLDCLKKPESAADLEKLNAAGHLMFMVWTCPSCDTYVWRKPKRIAFLNRLVDALSFPLGIPEDLAGQGPADCWAGVYWGHD